MVIVDTNIGAFFSYISTSLHFLNLPKIAANYSVSIEGNHDSSRMLQNSCFHAGSEKTLKAISLTGRFLKCTCFAVSQTKNLERCQNTFALT